MVTKKTNVWNSSKVGQSPEEGRVYLYKLSWKQHMFVSLRCLSSGLRLKILQHHRAAEITVAMRTPFIFAIEFDRSYMLNFQIIRATIRLQTDLKISWHVNDKSFEVLRCWILEGISVVIGEGPELSFSRRGSGPTSIIITIPLKEWKSALIYQFIFKDWKMDTMIYRGISRNTPFLTQW